MADTLYFYDLETSGINPREARIMQFAGQRTTLDLEPLGEPDNVLIRLTDDILPDPEAVLVTGLTPQQTLTDGITEREFCMFFNSSVAQKHTTIVGYNSVRFDNEFIRFTLYRNFYDPYEWSYKNSNSVWDLLDVVRMTRALRPNGITWPFASDGRPANSLELLTSVNKIEHTNAHDALADVSATIALARLINQHNPKLFSYLYSKRTKQAVARIVTSGDPFVYTSGRYSSSTHKTTVAVMLAEHPLYAKNRALVYDLRYNPEEFMKLSTPDLVERMQYTADETAPPRLPVKELVYGRCPAVAPVSVLTKDATANIALDLDEIARNHEKLQTDRTFINRVCQAFEQKAESYQTRLAVDIQTVDTQLYDGFFNDADKRKMVTVRQADASELADLHPEFADERLNYLLLLYKARQFADALSADEQRMWEQYRYNKFYAKADSRLQKYFSRIQELGRQAKTTRDKALLEELWLWGESVMPDPENY